MAIHLTIPSFTSPRNVLFYIGVGITSASAVKFGLRCLVDMYMEVLVKRVCRNNNKKRREKWAKLAKDTVILNQYLRGVAVPSPSPFALKLETYLRMAKIPYVNEFAPVYGYFPDVKVPYMVINGEEISSSAQVCIEYLAGKFGKDFSSHLSPMENATARAFQAMCEDHLYWMMSLWRHVYTNGFTMPLLSPLLPFFFISSGKRVWKPFVTKQGMGRHSEEEVTEMTEKDLRSLSLYLGSKPYFTGDKPTEVDCAMFGLLAEIVWTTPNSFMEKLVNGELVNLKQFCERMKEEFWPDWNECLFSSHFRHPGYDPTELTWTSDYN